MEKVMVDEKAVEAVVWMYTYACTCMDKGEDIRTIAVGDILAQAERDLK